ncbi:hypothetical protein BJ508DRAFT_58598 [Ascobolus immersus RN42]|uniref:Uncharacterized protein n=1 Tax=Ascobolus immersus RN42 TaxID=1160509 RepID=A0A3N4HHB9_ASCIM|nr:hypothetical protein BJ508DRAFT_58598 [Ascobolus immersus RN42]
MRAFHASVTALGDQQLIIGITTLISGITNCQLSFYELRNLVAVAWLSAVVLLMTVVVTGRGAESNPITRRIRALLMFAMLCLLVFITGLYIFADTMRPTLFEATQYFTNIAASDASAKAPDWNPVLNDTILNTLRSNITLSQRRQQENAFAAHFFTDHAMLLVYNAKSGWIQVDYSIGVEGKQIFKLDLFWHRVNRSGNNIRLPAKFDYGAYRRVREEMRWERTYVESLQHLPTSTASTPDGTSHWSNLREQIKYFVLVNWIHLPDAQTISIFWEILWLSFLLVQALTRFGICWVGFKHLKDADTERDIMGWGLGQVMAVTLLLSPVLTWAQIMFDQKDDVHSSSASTKVTPETECATPDPPQGPPRSLTGSTFNSCRKTTMDELSVDEFYRSNTFLQISKPWIYFHLAGTIVLALGQIFKVLEDLTIIHGIYHYFIIIFLVAFGVKLFVAFVKFLMNFLATDDMEILKEICESESSTLPRYQRPNFQTVMNLYRQMKAQQLGKSRAFD